MGTDCPRYATLFLLIAHAGTAQISVDSVDVRDPLQLDLHVVAPASRISFDPNVTADGSRVRPFTSVHDANEALRKYGGCDATISLHPGTHILDSRGTLRLSGEGTHRWQGLVGSLGERAILSGGMQVMGPWTEVVPGRWSAALPADAPLPKLPDSGGH